MVEPEQIVPEKKADTKKALDFVNIVKALRVLVTKEEFLYGRIRTLDDLKLLPFLYVKAIYIRFLVWKTAIKERVFVI